MILTEESMEMIIENIMDAAEEGKEAVKQVLFDEGLVDDVIPDYPYKIIVYKDNGDFDHEEYFETFHELTARHGKLRREKYAQNPTAWEYVDGDWERIMGY